MSKLNLTEFDDKDMTPLVLSPLVDEIAKLTGLLPEAIVVTEAQWKQYFFGGGELLTNFRGIPIETPLKQNNRDTVLKTIDSILAGMHTAGINDVPQVYRMLEGMKAKLGGESNV